MAVGLTQLSDAAKAHPHKENTVTTNTSDDVATRDVDGLLADLLDVLAASPVGGELCVVVGERAGRETDPRTVLVQQLDSDGRVQLRARPADQVSAGDVLHEVTTLDARADADTLRAAHGHIPKQGGGGHAYASGIALEHELKRTLRG